MVAEAGQSVLTQARVIATAAGQRIAGVEFVEVDPPPGLAAAPALAGYQVDRAPRAARPMRPVATEAGDSGISVMVVMTLRLAPPPSLRPPADCSQASQSAWRQPGMEAPQPWQQRGPATRVRIGANL